MTEPSAEYPEEANPDEVFQQHKGTWYSTSTEYWSKQQDNDLGMLGGFPELSKVDSADSRKTIEKYISRKKMGSNRIADCGAGIGRVSKAVFADYFKEIVLVDPVESFLQKAVESLPDSIKTTKVVAGIQSWVPEGLFDAFWVQWALMYLTDDDAISFLKRCKEHLSHNGKIFIKDNLGDRDKLAPKEAAVFFKTDNGLCRTFKHFLELFNKAGLTLIESRQQPDWDASLLPLYYFVLQ